jgi:hypothetical protein
MLTEGQCELCRLTLLPEINRGNLARSDVLHCVHCDRATCGRVGCDKCDVIFAWAPADIEGEI